MSAFRLKYIALNQIVSYNILGTGGNYVRYNRHLLFP